jgi:hypothetical protein
MKCTAFLPALLLGAKLLSPATVQADSNSERTWHLAYQKVLTAYSRMQGFEVKSADDPYGARWDLCDIDGDGTPELFISPDDSHVNGVMIYTCQSGDPVLLQYGSQQAFGENGLTAVNTDEHMIGSFHTGQGIVQRTFYKMENGKLTQLDSFMDDIESYPDDEKSKAVWQLNGHSVSKKQYDAAYEPYSEIVWREDVGRAYAFIDRSPLAAVKHSAVADDPPDMKKALLWGSIAALIAAVCAAIVSILWRAEK